MGLIVPAQLSSWFDDYSPTLVLYARQWLPVESAEDVVQDTFIRLMSQPREPANIRAWLFRSVRNAAISQLRLQGRRKKHERQLAADRQQNLFEHRTEDLIDASELQVALESLPQEQREIVVLRLWAGMTLRETAEVVGEPVSTLFSRYRSGLAALRRKLELSCKTKNA
ncbi:MAG: sigma-70 family RNA polymerase sigma factor [Planctomycetota bacterium]|nr:MAG: sigma-70 family RNA polymerase sigma factor [Planctomycetota bacterium]